MAGIADAENERRIQRALLAHIRQEFTAPAAAIVGYTDILIEDAKRLSLDFYVADLRRISVAGQSLHSLLQAVLAHEHSADGAIFDRTKLRHDLRTPINAIKGYGEMLVEDATAEGHGLLLDDLEKLLSAASGVLKKIDALVEFGAGLADNAIQPPSGMAGIVEAVRAIRSVAAAPLSSELCGRILIVDDNASNRDLLSRQLVRAGHSVQEAEGGHAALDMLAADSVDLILLDMMMPDMSGYEVLCRLKSESGTSEIPVIMISALDDLGSITRCLEAGAVDYLQKPFNLILLRARIGSSIENKLRRDREKAMMEELRREKARSEALLLSILPRSIVDRINAGASLIADRAEEVSIIFADLVGFTQMASRQSPEDLVQFLNSIFTAFDDISLRFGGEKIKTIGDSYMVAFGLPEARPDHIEAAAAQAQAMLQEVRGISTSGAAPISLRIGIHTGPVVAGVIGQRKFSFDVWGTTVNIASRMEAHGEPGKIHVSEAVARSLTGRYALVARESIEVKGIGAMQTFFLNERIA